MIKKTKRKKVIDCNLSEIYSSIAYNPDTVVIIHAPKSCSHIVYNGLLNSKRKIFLKYRGDVPTVEDNLFVTCMSDKEAIFGGEKLLERSIETVIESKHPKCVVVVSGCAASVIGDDAQSVCDKVEKKYNVPIIFIPGSGFMSVQVKEGLLLTTEYLYNKLGNTEKKDKDKNLALILGLNKYQLFDWEFAEIKRLYQYFGYSKFLLPPSGLSVEEWNNISSTSVIGVYAPTIEKLKEYNKFMDDLSQRLSIPNIKNRLPLSITDTYSYITELGKVLGMEEIAKDAVATEEKRLASCFEHYKEILSGQKCALALGHPLKFINVKELLNIFNNVGTEVTKIILLNDLTDANVNEYQKYFIDLGINIKIVNEEMVDECYCSDELIVTSIFNERFKRQFYFRRKRIGIGGVEVLLSKLSETMINNRSLGHE